MNLSQLQYLLTAIAENMNESIDVLRKQSGLDDLGRAAVWELQVEIGRLDRVVE